MLLHRAFTLIVLLIGVGLGLLLPRPWVEVEEAEAAKQATWTCLADSTTEVVARIHNLSESGASFEKTLRDFSGDIVSGPTGGGLSPRQTAGINGHATTEFRSKSPLLATATVGLGDDQRPVPCFKGK